MHRRDYCEKESFLAIRLAVLVGIAHTYDVTATDGGEVLWRVGSWLEEPMEWDVRFLAQVRRQD